MTSADLWGEWGEAQQSMTSADRSLLSGHGIAPGAIVLLVGAVRARVASGLYEPAAAGGVAYITPVLVERPETPESACPAQSVRFGDLVDLVLWHPHRPDAWAMRTGAGEWLGAIQPQHMAPGRPVPIRRSVLSWFQHDCAGLVPLCRQASDAYRLLILCREIEAENAEHAAALRRLLLRPWPAPRVTIAQQERRHAA